MPCCGPLSVLILARQLHAPLATDLAHRTAAFVSLMDLRSEPTVRMSFGPYISFFQKS
jgi:hypothetical protein